MLAPRRVPPCLIELVAASKTFKKLTGPLASPWVVETIDPLDRRREKENPVPPPDWWIIAAFLIASKIPRIESPTGRTKQAENCNPFSFPAFMRVGLFGIKRHRIIIS